MRGGVIPFRGSGADALRYVESDRSRADDYYLGAETSVAQFAQAKKIPASDARPGDLLFYAYDISDPGTIHHVGLYIGNGQMIHAPHTGDVVRIAAVYSDGLIGFARP